MEEWQKRKPLLKESFKKSYMQFATSHVKDAAKMRVTVLWSDETKIEIFVLNAKHYMCWKSNTAHHHEQTIPTMKLGCNSNILWGSLFSAETEKPDLMGRRMDPNTRESSKKTCYSLQKTWDRGRGSPSIWTMTLNIEPVLQWNDLDQRIFMH